MADISIFQKAWSWINYPVIATLIRSRRLAIVLAGVLVLQLLSVVLKIQAMPCPMLETTGVPCPGCGLTRGAMATIRMDWAALLQYNAFGPLALLAVAIVLVGAVLPGQAREKFAERIAYLEKTTGLTNLCFVALWVYWVARLITSRGALGDALLTSLAY